MVGSCGIVSRIAPTISRPYTYEPGQADNLFIPCLMGVLYGMEPRVVVCSCVIL